MILCSLHCGNRLLERHYFVLPVLLGLLMLLHLLLRPPQ